MTAVATYTAPGPSLLSAVRRVLGDADEALVCVAFAQVRGVELLRKELSDVAARRSARVLVTTSFGATDPRALAAIVDTKALVGVLNPAGATFHPKVFLGRRGRTIRAIVGSANLTGGLFTNVEVAMGIDGNHDDPALHRLWAWAEETWSDPRVERWVPPLGVVAAEAIEPELLALMQRVAMESPEVYTLGPRPRPNWLREVATSGAWVETERSRERGGAPVFVPSWMLNLAWEALRSRGTLSNRELLDELRVHRSSFVCALLARLPEIERVPGRDIVLRWTGGAPGARECGRRWQADAIQLAIDSSKVHMPLLYFWRADNYRRDLDEGAAFHLNQSSPRLHDVQRGDSVWAFTRDGERYVLAAELVVRAATRNPPGYPYGPYRIWGDRERSRYFAVGGGSEVETLIRGFDLSVGVGALGRSFQGRAAVRRLSPAEHLALVVFSRGLPLEPRARHIDEERLEMAVARASPQVIDETLYDLRDRLSDDRRRWVLREATPRSRVHVETLRKMYRGRCQLCAWESRTAHRVDVCEGHHLQWLSRGGSDAQDNMVLLCPNHHRLVHALDAPLDFRDLTFDLGDHRLALSLNDHLTAA